MGNDLDQAFRLKLPQGFTDQSPAHPGDLAQCPFGQPFSRLEAPDSDRVANAFDDALAKRRRRPVYKKIVLGRVGRFC